MKVKEVVAILQACNPEAEFIIRDSDEHDNLEYETSFQELSREVADVMAVDGKVFYHHDQEEVTIMVE